RVFAGTDTVAPHSALTLRSKQRRGGGTMSASRFALACEDPILTPVLAGHFGQFFAEAPSGQDFQSINQELGPHYDGIVVLAAAHAGDAGRIRHIVQEISLRCWPAQVLIVAAASVASHPALADLESISLSRFRWPEDIGILSQRLRALGTLRTSH